MELSSDDIETVQCALKRILQEEDSTVAISEDLPSVFNGILRKHPSISEDVCDVIAYLGRKAEFRTSVASNGSLVKNITSLISDKETNINLLVQALRAVGNLCHDEDLCRQQFLESGGCHLLKEMLTKCTDLPPADFIKFKVVTCGCLLNVCCDNEALCKAMLDLDVLDPLCRGLLSKIEDESVLLMGLKALCVIVEADSCTPQILSRSPVLVAMIAVLKLSISNKFSDDDANNVIQSVLEILQSLCGIENKDMDNWKGLVVESGCFKLLLDLPSEFIPKVIDLSIHLLSSDYVLGMLFSDEKLWAFINSNLKDSSVSVNVRASTVLMVANMARNDKNCEELARNGTLHIIKAKLLDLPVSEENSKLHYSLMSLLRNLSLPEANKLLMLQEDILPKVIVIMNQTNGPTVLMKTLGCLRLLSTRTEICRYLCIDNPSVDRICQICENASFDHVNIEGSRLIASIVKNSSDIEIRVKISENDNCLKRLVYLLKSEHMVIRNEGIVSLSLLASLKLEAFSNKIVGDDFNLGECLLATMKACAGDTSGVLENCLTLLLLICDTNKSVITEDLKSYLEAIKTHEVETTRAKVLRLLS